MKHPGLTNKLYEKNNDIFEWSEENFTKVQNIKTAEIPIEKLYFG